jgi:hypothetical protein
MQVFLIALQKKINGGEEKLEHRKELTAAARNINANQEALYRDYVATRLHWLMATTLPLQGVLRLKPFGE